MLRAGSSPLRGAQGRYCRRYCYFPTRGFRSRKSWALTCWRGPEQLTFPFTGIGSTTKKLREKPDEVKRMIKAGIRANRYVRQNRDGAIQVMMEWGKTDREAAANTCRSTWRIFSEDGGMTENGLKVVIDQAKQSNNIDRPVAVSVADFNFVRDAQRELGIKGQVRELEDWRKERQDEKWSGAFDSDMHVYDPAFLYEKYMNPKWGERIPRGQRNGKHGRVEFQLGGGTKLSDFRSHRSRAEASRRPLRHRGARL